MYKPDFSPNGDMQTGELVIFDQDFRIISLEDNVRGQYYPESNKSYIYLAKHECIEDIICSCVHETIHALIDQEDSDEDSFRADTSQEHWAIKQISWANENLV